MNLAEKVKCPAKGVLLYPNKLSLVNKTGSWKSFKPVVDKSKCIKCGRCWTFCPDIAIKKDKEGFFEADLDYCKGCGICANECPVKCIKMVVVEK